MIVIDMTYPRIRQQTRQIDKQTPRDRQIDKLIEKQTEDLLKIDYDADGEI